MVLKDLKRKSLNTKMGIQEEFITRQISMKQDVCQ